MDTKPVARFQLSARKYIHLTQIIERVQDGQANAQIVLDYIRAVFLTVGTELPKRFAYDLENDWLSIYDYPALTPMDTTQQGGAAEPVSFDSPEYKAAFEHLVNYPHDATAELLELRSALATATQEREALREFVAVLRKSVEANPVMVWAIDQLLKSRGIELPAAPPQTDNTPSHE